MSRTNLIVLIIFVVACLLLLMMSRDVSRGISRTVLQTISPLLQSGSATQETVTGWTEGIDTLEKLELSNEELQIENGKLRSEIQFLRDLKEENDRLREQLGYRQRSLFNLKSAEVLARNPRAWWNAVTVSLGSRDGVRVDQPVITPDGVVGRVVTVDDHLAQVLLLTDPNCRIAARVEGSQEHGIIHGSRITGESGQVLELNFLSREARLQKGQRVYTSGLGGIFPHGILLGRIESFRKGAIHGQALVRPAVEVSRLDSVFIMLGSKPQNTATASSIPVR